MPDADVLALFGKSVVLSRKLAARQLELIRQVDSRKLYAVQGYATVGMWAAACLNVSPYTADRLVRQLPAAPRDCSPGSSHGGKGKSSAAMIS